MPRRPYLLFLYSVDRVNRISARDIVRVVKRYMKKDAITWALSAHPDTIADIRKKNDPGMHYENAPLQ